MLITLLIHAIREALNNRKESRAATEYGRANWIDNLTDQRIAWHKANGH